MQGNATLAPYVHKYIRDRLRRGEISRITASAYWSPLTVLANAHGNRTLEQFGRGTLNRWRERRAHLKPSTQATQWSMVVCFSAWLADEGIIKADPCRHVKGPRRPRSTPRALESDDVALTLEVVPDARARAIVWLMVGMGLRCVEVHRLKIEDWQRREGIMLVTGKGSHEREVAVPSDARHALDAYLAEYPASSGPFIRGYTPAWQNRALRPGTLSHYVSAWMLAAGVKHAPGDGRSAHALRHTAASDVLDECGDLPTVQEMLGHQHLSSTSIYLRRAGLGKMRAAMEGRHYQRTPGDAA